MQTIEEIRAANLARLLNDGLSKADIARAMHKDPKQVGQWFGKGAKRTMSSATARALEAAIKKPRGWLDNPQSVMNAAESAQSVRLDLRTVADAKGVIRFLLPAGMAFDPHGDIDLFVCAYRHMTDDPAITRSALERAVADSIAARTGGTHEAKATVGPAVGTGTRAGK